MNSPELFGAGTLVPALIASRPWTLITYMFLHAGIGHIFFNMLSLFFFGSRLEHRLGGRQFVSLYLFSGLLAALASLIFTPYARIIGASGAVFGVMVGYARYWPRDEILIWGVFPVQARWLIMGMAAIDILGGAGFGRPGIANFAHLGGFVGGYLFLVLVDRFSPAARFKAQAAPPAAKNSSSADVARWSRINGDALHPVNRQELDRLRQKIAGGGVLTPDERAYLDRLSAG